MRAARRLGPGALLLAAALAVWLLAWPGARPRTGVVTGAALAVAAARSQQAGPRASGSRRGARPYGSAASHGDLAPAELPRSGVRAQHRVWLQAGYGPASDQLGRAAGVDGSPGFMPMRGGKLLVLDSAKLRLVIYGADGTFERALPLPPDALLQPADVSIAADGTIVVAGPPGAQAPGLVLLDAAGNMKARLPQSRDAIKSLYTAGNDVFALVDGFSTVKLGDSSGAVNDDTPGLPRAQAGKPIAGVVAPDGGTVLWADFLDRDNGQFHVRALHGEQSEEIFARDYRAPGVTAIALLQADAAGNVYLVLSSPDHSELVCLDSATGAPLGSVALPMLDASSAPSRTLKVAESGGLIVQLATAEGLTFEWFNCH